MSAHEEHPAPGLAPRRPNVRPWWHRADATATALTAVADPFLDALSPEGRVTMASVWQERGNSELRVGSTFCAVTTQLIQYGGDEMVMTLLAQAMRDEVYHSQISVEMASRYRGGDPLWPGPQPTHVPVFAPSEGKLRATLLVMTLCCINETVACGILEGQIAKVASPLSKAAAQTILSDEIDHARAGWAHLASRQVGPAILGELGGWLPRLLSARLNELAVEDAPPYPGEEYQELGVLSRRERKVIVHTTLHEVMLPGFARAGIDVGPASQWADETFGKRVRPA